MVYFITGELKLSYPTIRYRANMILKIEDEYPEWEELSDDEKPKTIIELPYHNFFWLLI